MTRYHRAARRHNYKEMKTMKYQYIIRSLEKSFRDHEERVRGELLPRFTALGPKKLKLSVAGERPPRVSLIPFNREPVALVSVWTGTPVDEGFLAGLAGLAGFSVGGYLVEESYPVADDSLPKPGGASPGVVLLTLLVRNPNLDYGEFMSQWFGRHTPMSLEIHPLREYIRNVVRENLYERQSRFEGIVEERFDTPGTLLNPAKMFGGIIPMVPNMIRIGRHVNHFLDLKQIETYYLKEYYINV